MKSHIRQNRAARWLAHVEKWRHSGMSKAAYCTAHGLNFSSFRYWLRKSLSASVDVPALPPAIIPLPFTLAPKPPSIGLMVGNRYALDVPDGFDEAMLTRLLSVLESQHVIITCNCIKSFQIKAKCPNSHQVEAWMLKRELKEQNLLTM